MFGQMYYGKGKISDMADYVQFDICGLSVDECVKKFNEWDTSKPIILHGDWKKNGASENDILDEKRLFEIQRIVEELYLLGAEILGITIHPPTRNKLSYSQLESLTEKLIDVLQIPVFIENRSDKKILLSNPEEIIAFSEKFLMTIDLPQLYISCDKQRKKFIDTLSKINWPNVKEIHLANVLLKDSRSYVGRKIFDGAIEWEDIERYVNKTKYVTLEILGGTPTFEKEISVI